MLSSDELKATPPLFQFDNSYARDLEGFYALCNAAKAPAPHLMKFNRSLAAELGLNAEALDSPTGAEIFSGTIAPEGSATLAQAYAGHQFGGFSPQLGDGRALLLGEVIDRNGQRRDLHLKGSGRTPFSRSGDGKATLGPVLREYLMGEAMHALGIPTTRALAVTTTGESVFRERPLPGAVLTRVAASHIRVGTFQFFAARGEPEKVRKLADYSIARHYPECASASKPYLALLEAVCERQAKLIAQWMHVGFIHGVMNTDNMAISGETIDYGPCAFMDAYEPKTVFSSIDSQGRYAYGNQPVIARWNLARFAETLLPLFDTDETSAIALATQTVNEFTDRFSIHWLHGMRAKLGLLDEQPGDQELAAEFLSSLAGQDFTQAFRALSHGEQPTDANWAARWRARGPSLESMRLVNPAYIPRNHKVEEALAAAVQEQDYRPFEVLLEVLSKPFVERPGLEDYTKSAPGGNAGYFTYCGT